jgi:hypothetical protein
LGPRPRPSSPGWSSSSSKVPLFDDMIDEVIYTAKRKIFTDGVRSLLQNYVVHMCYS